MAFNRPIDAIGAIRIVIDSPDGAVPFSGNIIVQGLYQGVESGKKSYDLVNNISAAQITAINNFLAQIRTKANAEAI